MSIGPGVHSGVISTPEGGQTIGLNDLDSGHRLGLPLFFSDKSLSTFLWGPFRDLRDEIALREIIPRARWSCRSHWLVSPFVVLRALLESGFRRSMALLMV